MYLVFKPSPLNFFRKQKSIGRCACKGSGFQVNKHLKLFFGISGTCWYSHCSQTFSPKLKPYPCSPEPIPWGDLNSVLTCKTCQHIAAHHHQGPDVYIFSRVWD